MKKDKVKPVMIKAMPEELWREIKAIAAREGTSIQQYIIDLLRWVIKQQ